MSRPAFPRPIAHRGLHDVSRGIVENSASAFAAAIEHGYAIECDLQLTADGVPVVIHDDDLQRLTGRPGRLRDNTAAVLRTMPLLGSAAGDTPQTFAALLEQVAGRSLLQVELKRQPSSAATVALASTVAAAIRGYRGDIVVESFDPHLLVALRRAGVSVPLGIITQAYYDPSDGLTPRQRLVLRHLLHWPATRFDFISCARAALHLPAIRTFRALGMPVTSWTIRSPADAEAALKQADQIVFEGFLPAVSASLSPVDLDSTSVQS